MSKGTSQIYRPLSPVTQKARVTLILITLAGCSSHQAPVSEQSQRLERTAPMILSSNNSGDKQLVETSRQSRVLSGETLPEIVTSVREALSDAAVFRAEPQQARSGSTATTGRALREPISERPLHQLEHIRFDFNLAPRR